MTNKQKTALMLFIEYPKASDREIASMCNATPAWLCNLKKKPEFQEALEKGLHEVWKDAARVAVQTMIKLSSEGDREASKFILQSAGYGAENNINMKLETNTIRVTIDD